MSRKGSRDEDIVSPPVQKVLSIYSKINACFYFSVDHSFAIILYINESVLYACFPLKELAVRTLTLLNNKIKL